MKGLLIKDFLSLAKQMKFFLLIIIVFACIPGYSFMTFALVYVTMLPMSSIAFDERSKWDKLAAMMPYSAMDSVLSKYLMGLILVLSTSVVICFGQAIVRIFTHTSLDGVFFTQLALVICFALIIESIELPVLIKFGVEKGRLLIILFVVIVCVGGASLVENVVKFSFNNLNLALIIPLAVLAAVVISTISVFISEALFKSKTK